MVQHDGPSVAKVPPCPRFYNYDPKKSRRFSIHRNPNIPREKESQQHSFSFGITEFRKDQTGSALNKIPNVLFGASAFPSGPKGAELEG